MVTSLPIADCQLPIGRTKKVEMVEPEKIGNWQSAIGNKKWLIRFQN
jgi:hypothetical protein